MNYQIVNGNKLIKSKVFPEGDDLVRMEYSIKMGLPAEIRGIIWEYIVKVAKYKSKSPYMYQNYLASPCTDNTDYTISKDILRTFPLDPSYKEDWKSGENSLFNVLKAYAAYDKNVKYWQGMNFIAFLFLKNLKGDEVSSFRINDGSYA